MRKLVKESLDILSKTDSAINEAFGLSDSEVLKELATIARLSVKVAKDVPGIIKEVENRQGKIRYHSLSVMTYSEEKTHTFSITMYFSLTQEQRDRRRIEQSAAEKMRLGKSKGDSYDTQYGPNSMYGEQGKWADDLAKKYGWKRGSAGNVGDQFEFTISEK